MTIIQDFADFAVNLKIEDIPPVIVEKVKLQILNSITAAKFSDWHDEAEKVFEVFVEEEKDFANASKTSTIIPLGEKLSPEAASAVNSAYAMSLDYDDYMLVSHMGYSSVLTTLAYLESEGGSISDLIRIATIVNEITGRLCLSCFFGPLNGQMLTYIHNLGAATVYGLIKRFDAKKLANALALSLYQPNFCLVPGFYKDGCKLLTSSIPIQQGIQAARYAELGIEGPLNIIEAPAGFYDFFAFHPIPEFTGDLGNSWLSHSLSYKRYPGTSYIAASVDSALDAINELGFDKIGPDMINKIKKIEIDTTIMSKTIESLAKMQTAKDLKTLDPILINFSVKKSVAYALVQGDLLPHHFKDSEIQKYSDQILRIIDKIKVRQDIEMTLNQFMTFPNVDYIIGRMSKDERKQVLTHLSTVNPEKQKLKDRLRNVYKVLMSKSGKAIIKGFLKTKILRRKKEISLKDVNLSDYKMLQSAKTKITFMDGRTAESYYPIPRGGCGLPMEDLKDWVLKRYTLSFGENPENVVKLLDMLGTSVKEFMDSLT